MLSGTTESRNSTHVVLGQLCVRGDLLAVRHRAVLGALPVDGEPVALDERGVLQKEREARLADLDALEDTRVFTEILRRSKPQ